MSNRVWRNKDELMRGDSKGGVAIPTPDANLKVVAHILYLGGYGRPTQFTSVSERDEAARHFAGKDGKVWLTDVASAKANNAVHIPRSQLMKDLTKKGKGNCSWDNPWEVSQSRVYVEQWSEHLFDWSAVPVNEVADAVKKTFR